MLQFIPANAFLVSERVCCVSSRRAFSIHFSNMIYSSDLTFGLSRVKGKDIPPVIMYNQYEVECNQY